MPFTSGNGQRRIEVLYQIPGQPLGRHVNHDPRSLQYKIAEAGSPASKLWKRYIPVLDQGNLGSCTGNAATGLLGSDNCYESLQAANLLTKLTLDEAIAKSIYSDAEILDGGKGLPTEDEGSSGLSVAQVCKKRGYISGYLHATSLATTLTALQTGPVITGVNWYEGFDAPDAGGKVKISGQVRGGHEFEIIGCDVEEQWLIAVNSWGTGYGDQGRFQFSFADFTRLLKEEGDVTQFVPLSSPAPTPTPTPTPTPVPVDVDANLAAALHAWEPNIFSRLTKAGKVKSAGDAWMAAHNL